MANVAVSQTDLFKASSSGDGSYFAPSTYWMGTNDRIYGMLFGGPPLEDHWASKNWRQLAPAFRADEVSAAVLFQVMQLGPGMVDFYNALHDAHRPAEFDWTPNETHIPHIPSHRLQIMTRNLDWFGHWLKGREDADSSQGD